jgi:hypothetical protein
MLNTARPQNTRRPLYDPKYAPHFAAKTRAPREFPSLAKHTRTSSCRGGRCRGRVGQKHNLALQTRLSTMHKNQPKLEQRARIIKRKSLNIRLNTLPDHLNTVRCRGLFNALRTTYVEQCFVPLWVPKQPHSHLNRRYSRWTRSKILPI